VTAQALWLTASYVFYGWFAGWPFLGVLVASSLANFALAAWIRQSPTTPRLWAGVGANVVALAMFKYLPAVSAGAFAQIIVPVGMSFWTFQAMSFLIDTYREEDVQPTVLEFCLYMAFWPTVVMGPICRLRTLLPQFRARRRPDADDVAIGLRRIVIGVFMIVALAGLLASMLPVDSTRAGATVVDSSWGGLDAWLFAVGYGFQLFFDFAGYSHLVIGAARLFGFRLDENFDAPFLSATPAQFWTKWHMSLSFWIRDYVFLPLSMAVRRVWWRYAALALSMALFGLWHGATLTFILWGVYHGVLLVVHRMGQQVRRRLGLTASSPVGRLVAGLLTFAGVSAGWILFWAADLRQAGRLFAAILSPSSYTHLSLPDGYVRLVTMILVCYFGYHASAALRLWFNRAVRQAATPDAPAVLPGRWWWLVPMIGMLTFVGAVIARSDDAAFSGFIYRAF
jgi:alginate O-acetyltransferase complex protein AlgI